MASRSQPVFAPKSTTRQAPPSASFDLVFCDDCDDLMRPDPDIHAVTGRDICPRCLEGYLS